MLSWLCNYLSNRRQRVRVGDNYSNYATCLQGVPQDNVLGTLLLVTYISKLVQCSPAEVSNLEYADDIMLECTHLSQSTVCKSLFTAVTALGTWLEDRGLLVNDRKTRVMAFQPRGASASLPPVLCGDELLITVHSVRYLGVTIDDGLTWNGHVDKVTKEVGKATGALWQSMRQLSTQSRLISYFSLIQSKRMYGSNAYVPSMTMGTLDRLNRLSKSAIRGFYGLLRWTPTSPILSTFQVRPLLSVMAQKIVLFVHRCLARRCSNLFHDNFVPVNCHQTRGCFQQLLVVTFWPGPHGRATIQFYGAVSWPCVRKRILASLLPSSSACLRVPISLNCRISSQLSDYGRITLLLFKTHLLLSHVTVIYLPYEV